MFDSSAAFFMLSSSTFFLIASCAAISVPDVAAGPIKLPSPLVAAPVTAPLKIPFIGSVPLALAESPPVVPPIKAANINGCIILFLSHFLKFYEVQPSPVHHV